MKMNNIENLIYSHMHPVEQLTVSIGLVDQTYIGVPFEDKTHPYTKQAKFKICPRLHNLDRLGQFIYDQAVSYFGTIGKLGEKIGFKSCPSPEKINEYLHKLIAQKKKQGSMLIDSDAGLRMDLSIDLLEPVLQFDTGEITYDAYAYPDNLLNLFAVPPQCQTNLTLFDLSKADEEHQPGKNDVCLIARGPSNAEAIMYMIKEKYPKVAGYIVVDDFNLKTFLKLYDIDSSLLNPGE